MHGQARSSRFLDNAKRWDDGGVIKPVFFYARRAAACLKLDGVNRPKTEGHSKKMMEVDIEVASISKLVPAIT